MSVSHCRTLYLNLIPQAEVLRLAWKSISGTFSTSPDAAAVLPFALPISAVFQRAWIPKRAAQWCFYTPVRVHVLFKLNNAEERLNRAGIECVWLRSQLTSRCRLVKSRCRVAADHLWQSSGAVCRNPWQPYDWWKIRRGRPLSRECCKPRALTRKSCRVIPWEERRLL